jgi:deoxyuridine 5'-triphosphate nucleotidohydrolase
MEFFIVDYNDIAFLPVRGSARSGCVDLCSVEEFVLCSGEQKLVKTNVGVNIPEGYHGKIAERSKLANKFGIVIGGGEIDQDYQGPLGVIMRNTGKEALPVHVGMAIAQYRQFPVDMSRPVWTEKGEATERGESGTYSKELRLDGAKRR